MQSTEEAIDAGVPMIGLPGFFDQWLNTHQYEKHQIGIQLNIDFLNEQEFRDSILAVVNDKKSVQLFFYIHMIIANSLQREAVSEDYKVVVQIFRKYNGPIVDEKISDT